MKKTLSNPIEALGIEVPHVLISRTSLEVQPDATEQDYAQLETILDTVGGSILWWQGDYLNHLASARGVEYAEAKAATSYAAHTLKNASWVCRHVARSRRRDRLSFGHHAEVAALSPTDQEIWLCKAEDEGWSVKELRAEIRQSKAQVTNGKDQAPVDRRASRASEGFEVFAAWFESEVERMTPDQLAGWDEGFKRLADARAKVAG